MALWSICLNPRWWWPPWSKIHLQLNRHQEKWIPNSELPTINHSAQSSLAVTRPSINRGRRCWTSVNVPLSWPWSPPTGSLLSKVLMLAAKTSRKYGVCCARDYETPYETPSYEWMLTLQTLISIWIHSTEYSIDVITSDIYGLKIPSFFQDDTTKQLVNMSMVERQLSCVFFCWFWIKFILY